MNISRIPLAFKALRELGPHKLGLFAVYKAGLRLGYFRWRKAPHGSFSVDPKGQPPAINHLLFDLPDPNTILTIIGPEGLSQLKVEADEIVAGNFRAFGGHPVQLVLAPPGELSHWSESHKHSKRIRDDIKFVWEPARFGWAFILGRAYHLTGDERYSAAFWRYFDDFQQANPTNQGPNWESAQEVALRLIAFVFAAHIFSDSASTTDHRQSQISIAVADHASRIPPTLIYARSQNNNHLLSEAAGLISASLALPDHPDARDWSKLGWKWFKRGLQTQISEDGSYMQQSTNYHRLLLQLGLWVFQLWNKEYAIDNTQNRITGELGNAADFQDLIPRLGQATRWLLALVDPETGRVPNLGPNDGAYILPLTELPFQDYRPVLQAAARAFLGEPAFGPGIWDEMRLWLSANSFPGINKQSSASPSHASGLASPSILRTPHSWAYLRAVRFSDRPGHADQLHLDLWWRGFNLAQDAGTYLYSAKPPWDNALTHTAVHNTVMIDGHQQMTPASRFLYLDWAQAEVLKRERSEDGSWERVTVTHDGYQRFRMMHIRSVTADRDDHWRIEDRIYPLVDDVHPVAHVVRLHWLLPDWKWKIDDSRLKIEVLSPHGWVSLDIRGSVDGTLDNPFDKAQDKQFSAVSLQLVRAGELLKGAGDFSPTWGWVSPTYSVKLPALSFSVCAVSRLPVTLVSDWRFPGA